jgi:hypothetical protein
MTKWKGGLKKCAPGFSGQGQNLRVFIRFMVIGGFFNSS